MTDRAQVRARTRIYELAKDLGVPSSEIIQHAAALGIFVRSASSPLTPPEERKVRRAAVAAARADAPRRPEVTTSPTPADAAQPPAAPRPRSPRGAVHELSAFQKRLLETVVLPRRGDARDTRPPSPGEVERARDEAKQWAEHWFEAPEALEWIEVHRTIEAQTAALLRAVGLTPEQASARIWFGSVAADRPTLAQQVLRGDITPEQAKKNYEEVWGNAKN